MNNHTRLAISALNTRSNKITWLVLLIATLALSISGFTVEEASNKAFLEFGQLMVSYSWILVAFIFPVVFFYIEYRAISYRASLGLIDHKAGE